MYPIRYYGDPVLRKKAAAVDTFDAELEEFCRILADKMYEYDGVGLAAPQIGVSRRVVAIDVTGGIEEPIVMVNPEILSTSEEELSDTEGCLSIPGISAVVTRPAEITVRGYSPQGEELRFENVTGFLCRAFQHEIDHLNGVLFTDRVSSGKKMLLKGKLKKMAKATQKRLR